MRRNFALAIALCALLPACARTSEPAPPPAPPVMGWDHRPEAAEWTQASFAALESHGAPLVSLVPRDVTAWCPGYPDATEEERAAFWAGMFSALARHESTWNPSAVGGGGRWFGLVQIAPATARGYGCRAGSGDALKDGSANLACAIRIAARTVSRDGVVAASGGGLAADWGPFHSSAKREQMRDWVSRQSYCSASDS